MFDIGTRISFGFTLVDVNNTLLVFVFCPAVNAFTFGKGKASFDTIAVGEDFDISAKVRASFSINAFSSAFNVGMVGNSSVAQAVITTVIVRANSVVTSTAIQSSICALINVIALLSCFVKIVTSFAATGEGSSNNVSFFAFPIVLIINISTNGMVCSATWCVLITVVVNYDS